MSESSSSSSSDVRRVEELHLDPRNRRGHPTRNASMMRESLRAVGAARSIVIDEDDVVLAGNGVTEAARAAGITDVRIIEASGDELIAVRRRGLTPEQKRVLAMYDNRTAELAEWIPEALAADVSDGLDMRPFFFENELQALLPHVKTGRTDPDVVPPERATKIVRGDVFTMGAHRLVCGDATLASDVARACGDVHPSMMWTDPPYGVSYRGKTKRALTIANDDEAGLRGILDAAFTNADAVLVPGAPIYIARPPGALSVTFGTAFLGVGWHLHEELIWVKDSMVLGHSDYHLRHETVLYGWKPGAARAWYAGRTQTSVFEVPRPKASPDHPTGKPVALVAAHLVNSSEVDDVTLEPFAGSGTTMIACNMVGRRCIALELEPRYCQVIVDRWEAFTGMTAQKVTP